MTRLYVSGPVSGLDYKVAKANFEVVCHVLHYHGYQTQNPLDVQATHCIDQSCLPNPVFDNHHSWECWLKHDIAEMLFCDGVAMMDGWQDSYGARLEVATATHVKMPTRHFSEWVSISKEAADIVEGVLNGSSGTAKDT